MATKLSEIRVPVSLQFTLSLVGLVVAAVSFVAGVSTAADFSEFLLTVGAGAVLAIGYAYAMGSGSPVGYYKFDNPKLIETQTAMEFNIEWGANAPANTALFVCFHGSRVYKH